MGNRKKEKIAIKKTDHKIKYFSMRKKRLDKNTKLLQL